MSISETIKIDCINDLGKIKTFTIEKTNLTLESSFFSGLINFENKDSYKIVEDINVMECLVFYFKNRLLKDYRKTYTLDFLKLLKKKADYYSISGLLNLIDAELNYRLGYKNLVLPLEINSNDSLDSFMSFVIKSSLDESIQMNIVIKQSESFYDIYLRCYGKKHCMLSFTISLKKIKVNICNVDNELNDVLLWGGKSSVKLCSIQQDKWINTITGSIDILYFISELIV
jgi:hypothetical protein